MNKEVKFSRFVGVAFLIICIWIVVLALLSAIMQNENSDNMIYVDEGSKIDLGMPKSNIISNLIDFKKEITTESGVVDVKVRLPKINIETEAASSINEKIYKIYQDVYADILTNNTIQKIYVDYTYEYLDNDAAVEIIVVTNKYKKDTMEQVENKFMYDLDNDKVIIK